MSYLATSSEWLAKANDEVRSNAARYAKNPNGPLLQQLDDVPIEAREAEFPVIDMYLGDSLRLNLLGTAFSLFAVAELTYMTYHLDWTVFLFAHTIAEVFDLVAFVLVFAAAVLQIAGARRPALEATH